MPRNKATNQYYGKRAEIELVNIINKENIIYNEYQFTEKEISIFNKHMTEVAKYLNLDGKVIHNGLHTSDNGDIILPNGDVLELKYIGGDSKGTYHNTTLNYFNTHFHINYKDFMEKHGLYATLIDFFGDEFEISRENASPISDINISSFIRHNYEDVYKKEIVPLDRAFRQDFVSFLVNHFENNYEDLVTFFNDMLNKVTADEDSKKKAPDRMLVYDYKNEKLHEINMKELLNKKNEHLSISIHNKGNGKGLGFTINGIRFQIAWGNGSGLTNPVIRVQLK